MHDAFTIGIPTFVVLLGILLSERRSTELAKRIDGVEAKIDGVEARLDQRIDSLEAKLDQRIDGVEAKIDGVEARLDQRIDSLEAKFDRRFDILTHDLQEFYRVTGRLEGRVDEIAKR